MLSLRTSIAASAAIGLCLIFRGGFQPDGYLIHVLGVLDAPYPLQSVLLFCGLVGVESFLLYALLTYPRQLGEVWRALIAFTIFAAWTCLLLLMSMHQAPPYFGHLLWALGISVVLLVHLIGSAIRCIHSSTSSLRRPRA